jgi:hypothetical protein
MHQLLNSDHRYDPQDEQALLDPLSSLFFVPTTSSKVVSGTKRIGPNPLAAQTAGNDDTFQMRSRAENFPR